MILAWLNRADAATLIAGSEVASLPVANIQNPHVSKKWHTAGTVTSSSCRFDMGSSVSCSLLALLGTNLTSAATIRIRASDTDPVVTSSLAYDSGLVSAGVKDGYGAIYKSFAAATARYWRFDLSDATLPDHIEVGRVFIGPKWQISTGDAGGGGGQIYNWSVTPMDPSRRDKSYAGQSYADILPQQRLLQFTLDWMGEAEMYGNAFALARANGIVTDVLAIPDIAGAYLSEQAVWGLITTAQPLVHRASRIYQMKFEIEERL